MYKVAKLKLRLMAEGENKTDDIDQLLSIMFYNGLILNNYIVKEEKDELFAYVTTTDDDSLNKKYYNSYLKEQSKRISIESIEIIGNDALCTDSCHCQDYDELFLCNHDLSGSPVYCSKCGKEIPLFKLLPKDEEYEEILNWQIACHSMWSLWMYGLSDRFCKRQFEDYKSQLNKNGMEICRNIESKTGKKTYLLINNPIGGWWPIKQKLLNKCPCCNKDFVSTDNSISNKICIDCRIAFNDSIDK